MFSPAERLGISEETLGNYALICDEFTRFDNDYIYMKNGSTLMLLSPQGDIVFESDKFNKIYCVSDTILISNTVGEIFVFNKLTNKKSDTFYLDISPAGNLHIAVGENLKKGILDSNGNTIAPFIYYSINYNGVNFLGLEKFWFRAGSGEDFSSIVRADRTGMEIYGIENTEIDYVKAVSNKVVTMDNNSKFSNSHIPYGLSKLNATYILYGLNIKYNKVTECKYTSIKCNMPLETHKMALVYINNKCGIVDFSGKELVPVEFVDCMYTGYTDYFIVTYQTDGVSNKIYNIFDSKSQKLLCDKGFTGYEVDFRYKWVTMLRDNKRYYLGNAGNITVDLTKAFTDIYRYGGNKQDILVINIYGRWYVIDSYYNLLDKVDIDSLPSNSTYWSKVMFH